MNAVTQQRQEDVFTTVYGIPIRNLWHMLLYAWNEVPISDSHFAAVESSPSLDALLALILAHLMQQRLRIGLGRSYVDNAQFIRGIRGRIDFNESLKKLSFQKSQAFCRFQHYDTNAPKNQIVRSILVRLVQSGEFGPDRSKAEELRHTLRRLVRDLEGIDIIELNLGVIRRQQLGRNDRDYRLMLAICELLLQRLMPSESAGDSALPMLDRDALTLYRVYERFVANFYKFHLKDWNVASQVRFDWHATQTSKHLPAMLPDLVLRHKKEGQIVVLDTKFTAACLITGRGPDPVFSSSHLYQMYAYLRSQEHLSDHHRHATGILLYPAARYSLCENVQLQEHEVCFRTIDLTQAWMNVEADLLSLAIIFPKQAP